MKKPFSLPGLLAAVACALSLGACNRAQYAALPSGPAYYNSGHVAAPATAHRATPITTTDQLQNDTPQPATAAPAAVAAVKDTPQTQAPATAKAPAATATVNVQDATTALIATTIESAATESAAPTAEPSFAQRILANKVLKKVSRIANKMHLEVRTNAASTTKSGISGNIKLGIILMVIGAVVALLPGLFRLLGLIIFIIGLLFLLLALLDMV